MLKYRIALILISLVGYFSPSYGQHDYTIKFKINGLKDTTCMLVYYYSNGTYIKDTLKFDHSGRCTYKAPATLQKGLYALVITEKNYFDFVINNEYKFSLETNVVDPTRHLVIKDSPDNELFYEYMKFNRESFEQIQNLQNKIKPAPAKNDSLAPGKDVKDSNAYYNDKINAMNKDLIAYRLGLVKKHPESFIALMINTMKEPDIPENPVLPNGRKDSLYAYRFYTSHFWDDVTFLDDRVLRTPVFHNKLKKYFDNVLIQHVDTVMHEADILIERARPNQEMFKYILWFVTYHYENSDIMGFDRIFVHVVDKYYATGQTTWLSKEQNEKVIKRANKIHPILLGEKAPNMIMTDTTIQWVSMHAIQAKYLLVVFWDPDCGHCEKEIPIIRDFYDQNKDKYGMKIFAVCTDTSLVKWKNGIIKKKMNWINVDGPRTLTGDYHEQYDINSTPVILLLDEEKNIIAKRLAADKIGYFLDHYIQEHKKK